GIDQSVLGLLARLETTENSTAAMTAEVERMIDELRGHRERASKRRCGRGAVGADLQCRRISSAA
ncbi:MAG: hypothetical protein AAGJ50_15135, partial [Pseudomonadota bacterium]